MSQPNDLPSTRTTTGRSNRFRSWSALVILCVVAALAIWLWILPWYWIKRANQLVTADPAQADLLAESAIGNLAWGTADAWLVRCRAQVAMNRPMEALGAFAQIKAPQSCDPAAWCSLIAEAEAARHSALAELALTESLKFANQRARMLAFALPRSVHTHAPEDLQKLIDELRQLATNQADLWHAIGRVERERGRPAEAASAFRSAVHFSSRAQATGAAVRRDLSELLIELGEFSAAQLLVDEMLQQGPHESGDFIRQAELKRVAGDLPAALLAAEQALQLDNRDQSARKLRGRLRMELNQLDEAQQDFESFLSDEPNDAEAHYRLSQILLRTGSVKESKRHRLEHQRLTDLHHRIIDLQFQRAANPDNVPLMDETAATYEALGQRVDALQWRRAAEAKRNRPTSSP